MDHVGLWELLKLCLIESVLLPIKLFKLEFLLKIWHHVVTLVEMDATEDILMLLGNTGVKLDLLPEIYTMLPTGANHMLFPHAIITLKEPLNLALLQLKPHNANKNVELDGKILMIMTKLMVYKDTDFIIMKKLSKLNYSPMDLLKLHSQFMQISPLINLEFITMFPELLWVDTLLN